MSGEIIRGAEQPKPEPKPSIRSSIVLQLPERGAKIVGGVAQVAGSKQPHALIVLGNDETPVRVEVLASAKALEGLIGVLSEMLKVVSAADAGIVSVGGH